MTVCVLLPVPPTNPFSGEAFTVSRKSGLPAETPEGDRFVSVAPVLYWIEFLSSLHPANQPNASAATATAVRKPFIYIVLLKLTNAPASLRCGEKGKTPGCVV